MSGMVWTGEAAGGPGARGFPAGGAGSSAVGVKRANSDGGASGAPLGPNYLAFGPRNQRWAPEVVSP